MDTFVQNYLRTYEIYDQEAAEDKAVDKEYYDVIMALNGPFINEADKIRLQTRDRELSNRLRILRATRNNYRTLLHDYFYNLFEAVDDPASVADLRNQPKLNELLDRLQRSSYNTGDTQPQLEKIFRALRYDPIRPRAPESDDPLAGLRQSISDLEAEIAKNRALNKITYPQESLLEARRKKLARLAGTAK